MTVWQAIRCDAHEKTRALDNINLTGIREPDTYGRVTFEDINREIMQYAQKLGLECEIFQSNHEGV